MIFFKQPSKICTAKPAMVAATLLVLVSCANISTTDSQSNRALANKATSTHSFVPKNTDGNPQVNTGNPAVDAAINQQLMELVDQWQCPAEGESQFNIERHSLNADYLSIQYSAMQLCSGMPSPYSSDDALTFSLIDGSDINLETLTQCNSIEQVGIQAGSDAIKAGVEGCPAPQFSGDFFKDKDNISLLNFYPTHNDIGCEFEVVRPLSELMCQ